MPENFERFDAADMAASGNEKAGENDEKFRDRYRKSQAAIKKIRKQERKKKKQDNTLAHIIVQFLNDPRFTKFFVLISRVIARNIPSDIVLAILSLIHRESANAIEEKKLKLPTTEPSTEQNSGAFPPHLKAHINRWTQNITIIGVTEPHRALETLLDHDWNLDQNIVELAVAVLQQFFVFQKTDLPPVENLRGFCEGFFKTLVNRLEQQVHHQGALGGDVDEDFVEE